MSAARLSCFAYTINVRCSIGTKTLRKIRAHRIKPEEVEQALSNSPIAIYEQDIEGELHYVYYGETDSEHLLVVALMERDERIRVVTA
ncbi:MAG: BrnT family toxin [Bryobacteraceae bacterium]